MDAEYFVNIINTYVKDQTIKDIVSNYYDPPGRKPEKMLLNISNWIKNLDDEQKLYVEKIIKDSVQSTLFSLFSVIDGSRVVDVNIDKFLIYYKDKSGKCDIINGDRNIDIHDWYAPD